MRYKDFKIVETKLREEGEVYVIGDSHAVAMGGSNNLAANGARLRAIGQQASQVPNGATVYMTGGHNDVTAGVSPQVIANAVRLIINNLKNKGCTVNYILFPEGSENENQDKMAPTRQAINSAVDVAQDLDGCSMQSDGIHCSLGSYRGLITDSNVTPSTRNTPEEDDEGLRAGPPYPPEDMDRVRGLQSKLEGLGYSVGSTGIDGKYGPRTADAVRAFKADFDLEGDGLSVGIRDLMVLSSAEPKENPTVANDTPMRGGDELASIENLGDIDDAKAVAEEFLGTSSLSDDDMNMLIRATAAEASPNARERAAVAAVILNRVRHRMYPNDIRGVLYQENQFQAVTGTPLDRSPSRNYSRMSDRTGNAVIQALIAYLPDMPKTWLNFTSNNPDAYGAGTNINFMAQMRRAPNSRVIGQTVFGTA